MAAAMGNKSAPQLNKYRITRRGRKLQIADEQRTLMSLPKDVPERTWAEILQKEETDLMIFDLREEIIEEVLRICYEQYMERQNAIFTTYCAAEAWLKIIDWNFYRHDPGEEPSAAPLCYIPKRAESWQPDELPQPSPKDTWGKQDLEIVEGATVEPFKRWPSSDSLDYPVVDEIPEEYWFPGKIVTGKVDGEADKSAVEEVHVGREPAQRRKKSPPKKGKKGSVGTSEWDYTDMESELESVTDQIHVESEVLQKITDYTNEMSRESTLGSLRKTRRTSVDGSVHGAGDSMVDLHSSRKRIPSSKTQKSKTTFGKSSVSGDMRVRRSRQLADSSSGSRLSVISDCRLRNLRLETQYEISSEKMSTPLPEIRKK